MQKSTGPILQLLYQRKKIIIVIIIFILFGVLITFPQKTKTQKIDAAKIAEEINQKCLSDSSNRCIKTLLTSFAKEHQFEQSKLVLDQLQKINKNILYCHTFAHSISIAEVEKNPENWLNVFSYVPDTECSYGYFHGVIEGKYKTDQDFKVDEKVIDKVCLAKEMKDASKRSCTHAFGHILLVQNESDVLSSLDVCKKINTKITESCYQGIFMENIQKENLTEHGISNRVEWNNQYLTEQINLCNGFKNYELTECWRSLKPVIMSIVSSPEKAIDICLSAPTYQAARACSRDINGQYFLDITTSGQQLSQDLCKPFNENQEKYHACIQDIISYVVLTIYQLKAQLHDNFCTQLQKDSVQFCQNTVQKY